MSIYSTLILITITVVYIVDVSGFTQSWKPAVLRRIKKRTGLVFTDLKPFDCSKCLTFWATLLTVLVTGNASWLNIAACCLLSLLTYPVQQALWLLQSIILLPVRLIQKLIDRI